MSQEDKAVSLGFRLLNLLHWGVCCYFSIQISTSQFFFLSLSLSVANKTPMSILDSAQFILGRQSEARP